MATAKFGELIMNALPDRLDRLTTTMFDAKIVTAYNTDSDRHNQSSRLATFDSIHDFKTFGTNPVDTIEYSRSSQAYNINRCFFNFNRIMCRGAAVISTENSYLTKPKGQDAYTQGAYDNKPTPITSIANVEDYFCLLNLYRIANTNTNDLYIIKGTPKVDPHNELHADNYTTITNLIKNRGWSDNEPNGISYINTVTDVSPVFRKYYISPNKNISETNSGVQYRSLVAQENANDPAGSLGKDLLSNAFGPNNVCIENVGQSRTYETENINSYFEPTLGGINNLTTTPDIQFNIELTLNDTTENSPTLDPEISIIPYSKSGAANPNERTVINKNVNAMFNRIQKRPCVAGDVCTALIGRDNVTHDNATRFYADPTVAAFSNDTTQKQIARSFTRKRLGDVLLASVCRLMNSDYNDNNERIKFTSLTGEQVIPRSAIFIGEDRMIVAFCLMNKIPCIYDNKHYTILYLPTRVNSQYTIYATMNAPISGGSSITKKSNLKVKQSGGAMMTRSEYAKIYSETMWEEPYYFYKYLHIIGKEYIGGSQELSYLLEDIDRKIIRGNLLGNVVNVSLENNPKTAIMYYVCAPISEDNSNQLKSRGGQEHDLEMTPNVKAQNIIDDDLDAGRAYTFIRVDDLLSVTQTQARLSISQYRTVYLGPGKELIVNRWYADFKAINPDTEDPENNSYGGKSGDVREREPVLGEARGLTRTDLYNKNVSLLQKQFNILTDYERYSIMDEASEADFYDINDSGVVVAFDCFFYILFNNLVNDFKNQANTISYELLIYYLFVKRKELYISFNEMVTHATGNKIQLDDKILNMLTSEDPSTKGTISYFNNLFDKSLTKRAEINKTMRDLFMTNQHVKQYECAIDNKFTHYGFSTIKGDFDNILNPSLQKSPPKKAVTLPKVTTFTENRVPNMVDNANARGPMASAYGGVKRTSAFIKSTHKIRAHRRKRSNKKKRGTHNKSHKHKQTRKKHAHNKSHKRKKSKRVKG